tara:strand:+ start:8129 stop:9961 length:1833 start_codon:yes stop_codon:yes gene_type:complete
MCGLAGCISDSRISKDQIHQTLRSMNNRGPDAYGYKEFVVSNKFIYLLHTRLNILDLNPRSNQPFFKNHYYLIFNGEIYNFIELKDKLISKGYKFETTSDTEVLINAFIEYGHEIETHLEGMWSFVIFDSKKNEFYFSRDRFGEKPLFFSKIGNNFFFGSEIKYIKNLSNNRLELNYEKLKMFLVYGYKSIYKQDTTYYKNLSQLQSSHKMKINLNLEIKIEKYWEPSTSKIKISLTEAIEGAQYFLENSLKKRLRADVPIAFNLSGGVDSSSLVAIARKKLNINVNSYSIIDDDPRYNEEENINFNAQQFSDNHKSFNLKNSFTIDNLKNLIDYHDQPLCTINYVAHALLQKQISNDGYKVSISGIAADEIFTGYYDHHIYYLHNFKNHEIYNDSLYHWKNHIRDIVRNPFLNDPNLFEKKGEDFRDYIYLNSKTYKSFLKDQSFNINLKDDIFDKDSLLRNRMLNELFRETVPILLENEDLNSMKYSIENRSPMLDTDLINFMNSVPTQYLIINGYSKYLLRETTKNILSDKIRLNRTKKGFNVAINSILDLNKPSTIEFLLSDGQIFNLIDKDKFKNYLLNENFYENSDKKFLFNFLNSKIFLDLNS